MKKFIKCSLFSAIFFCIAFFVIPRSENVYAATPYFDDEGNLYYVVYEKLYTSSICYRSVGWTFKKYDDAIGAPGQVSGVLPEASLKYQIEDKDNKDYFWIYFVWEKEDVLKLIGDISKEWKNSLVKYGGFLYFDDIMTIVEYGVPMGGMNSDGTTWGEVYFDFEGISRARGWGFPEVLRRYYDLEIEFPVLEKEPEPEITVEKEEETHITSSMLTSSVLGSHSLAGREYDVKLGIPSGEDLFVLGNAPKYYCEATVIRYDVNVLVPVEVVTEYVLKWTDRYGQSHSETRNIRRWYTVDRKASFYAMKNIDMYTLQKIIFSGSYIDGFSQDVDVGDIDVKWISYDDIEYYFDIGKNTVSAGRKEVYSSNNYKPDIPDENQQKLADKCNVNLKTRNDRVVIDGQVIMDGQWESKFIDSQINADAEYRIYRTDLLIDGGAPNGKINDAKIQYLYRFKDKNKQITNPVDGVNVHTPVVIHAGITTAKQYNMAVEPSANQIVTGTGFAVKASYAGNHREIPGYGYKDYESFVGSTYVRFPFDVEISGKRYLSGSWIEMKKSVLQCRLPKEVPCGKYEIEIWTKAYNADGNMSKENTYPMNANLSPKDYGAIDTVCVEVIGVLYGFNIKNMTDSTDEAYVGMYLGFFGKHAEKTSILPLTESEGKNFRLDVLSIGHGADEEDYLEAEVEYFVLEGNKRVPVDLYIDGERDIGGDMRIVEALDKIVWSRKSMKEISDNIYNWSAELNLEGKILVMPKGVEPTDAEVIDKYGIRGGKILINLTIVGKKSEKCVLSYANVDNSLVGYCNMWKKEGFNYENIDKKDGIVTYCDGDSVIIDIPSVIYEDYEIIGTH